MIDAPLETSANRTDTLLVKGGERKIGVIAFDGIMLLSIALSSVFAAANRLIVERGLCGGRAPYKVLLLSQRGGLVTTTCGLQMMTDPLANHDAASFDTISVGGGSMVKTLANDGEVVSWLRAGAGSIRRIASFGGGAFVLAKAGLLDDKRCVTHWRYAADLQRAYPHIRVDSDALFARDEGSFTAAGSSANIDVALQMVEEDFGRPLAIDIARALLVSRKRPGEQPQVSAELKAQFAATPRVASAAEWIVEHIDRRPSVAQLADQFAMSERNFSRAFKKAMGVAPQQFMERAKLEAARRWLADSDLPIEKVARRSGFSGGNHLAQSFRKLMGLTPAEYRAAARQTIVGQGAALSA